MSKNNNNNKKICINSHHWPLNVWASSGCTSIKDRNQINPRPELIKSSVCMNYHIPRDELKCNFHTFHPVIPLGFIFNVLFTGLGIPWLQIASQIEKTEGLSIRMSHVLASGRMYIRGWKWFWGLCGPVHQTSPDVDASVYSAVELQSTSASNWRSACWFYLGVKNKLLGSE